jgi:hypothetical protein
MAAAAAALHFPIIFQEGISALFYTVVMECWVIVYDKCVVFAFIKRVECAAYAPLDRCHTFSEPQQYSENKILELTEVCKLISAVCRRTHAMFQPADSN